MAFEESRWRYSAAQLGYTVIEPTGVYGRKACFEHLLRTGGAPPGPGPVRGKLWMQGRAEVAAMGRAVDVLVLPDTESVQTGTGENTTTTERHYTLVVARIDPPLFVGLQLDLERPVEVFGKMPSIATGDPAFDNTFLLNARSPNLALPIVRRQSAPPNDAVDHMFALTRHGKVEISDTTVAVKTLFTDDPAVLAPRIAAAASLAAFLASRRGTLPRDAQEQAILAAWRGVAARERLAFDEARMVLDGTIEGGARVRLSVESERPDLFTSVTLFLPRSLELGLELTRQGSLQFIKSIFGSQDIRVGDDAFDKAFVVKGKNVAGVKALLAASAPARQALLELLSWAPDMFASDRSVFARWAGIANEAALARAVSMARAVAVAFAR